MQNEINNILDAQKEAVLEPLERLLGSLNEANSSLYAIIEKIQNSIDDLKSQGNNNTFSSYYGQLFKTQLKDNSNEFIKIARARKPERQEKIRELQHDLYEFLGILTNQQTTEYVFYYIDNNGRYKRVNLGGKEIENQKFSLGARSLTLTKDAITELDKIAQDDFLSDHIANYVEQTYETIPPIILESGRANYNMGHVMESFENHYQRPKEHKNQDWSKEELKDNLQKARGNTPWWVEGDVNNFQVKYLGRSNTVSLGSWKSLDALSTFVASFKLGTNKLFSNIEIQNIAQTLWNGILYKQGKLNEEVLNTITKTLKEKFPEMIM